ncbi:MAG: YceI family protein [Roseobacter sp.]
MKSILLASAFSVAATAVWADAVTYDIDPTHTTIVMSYGHAGFGNTNGLISGVTGTIDFDAENPAASSVNATIDVSTLTAGDTSRDEMLLSSGEYFKTADFPVAEFVSTGIEVTGENTALITGNMTINGMTNEIVLDTVLNAAVAEYPFPPTQGRPAIGLTATTTVIRSDYGLGMFAPFIADEVNLTIDIEAIDLE